MRIISHRGNLSGPSAFENSVTVIDSCKDRGLSVELDVWKLPGEDFYRLGHDEPRLNQAVPLRFLEDPQVFLHCKNEAAYESLKVNQRVQCFKHDEEPFVLVEPSKSIKWLHSSYSGEPDPSAILVVLGKPDASKLTYYTGFYGICTDHPFELNGMLKNDKIDGF